MKEQKFESYFGRKIAIDASMSIYQFLVRTLPFLCIMVSEQKDLCIWRNDIGILLKVFYQFSPLIISSFGWASFFSDFLKISAAVLVVLCMLNGFVV